MYLKKNILLDRAELHSYELHLDHLHGDEAKL